MKSHYPIERMRAVTYYAYSSSLFDLQNRPNDTRLLTTNYDNDINYTSFFPGLHIIVLGTFDAFQTKHTD